MINIKKNVAINNDQAKEIMDLLNGNEWNRPLKPYSAAELLQEHFGYFLAFSEDRRIIGIARLRKVQWYQWEIFNISVDKNFRRQGIARSLIDAIELHVASNYGGLLQATVDPQNKGSKRLLRKHGFQKGANFIHPFYKKTTEVWNKSIEEIGSKMPVVAD